MGLQIILVISSAEQDKTVTAGDILEDFGRAETGIQIDPGSFRSEGFIDFDQAHAVWCKKGRGPAGYRAIEKEGVVVGYEKREMRFMFKDIGSHQSLFLIHYVWRVAQDHVEASSKDIVRRNICQYVRLDEGRSNGARRTDLICEVLR